MKRTRVISIANQKGGVGKTTTTVNLGVALANKGKKILLIDFDPQGNLTKSFGFKNKETYNASIKEVIMDSIEDKIDGSKRHIISTKEGVDIIPANLELSGIDLVLSSVFSRERILKNYIDEIKQGYDYVLIDTNPALNLFTINALCASDSVIIPVQAEPYALDGLNDLLKTIKNVKKNINPELKIDGAVVTLFNTRTNLSKHITNELKSSFGKVMNVFDSIIPICVDTSESILHEVSSIKYNAQAKSSKAYIELAKEVDDDSKKITKNRNECIR